MRRYSSSARRLLSRGLVAPFTDGGAVRAGKLRHLGTLLYPASNPDAPDDVGDTPSGWLRGPEVYFGVEALAARELFMAQQVRADVTHKITMRFRDEVTARCGIEWTTGARTRIWELGPPLSTEERLIDMTFTAVEKR